MVKVVCIAVLKLCVMFCCLAITGGLIGSLFLDMFDVQYSREGLLMKYQIKGFEYETCIFDEQSGLWGCSKADFTDLTCSNYTNADERANCWRIQIGQFALIFSHILMAFLQLVQIVILVMARDNRSHVIASVSIFTYWFFIGLAHLVLIYWGFEAQARFYGPGAQVAIQPGAGLLIVCPILSIVAFILCAVLSFLKREQYDSEEFPLIRTDYEATRQNQQGDTNILYQQERRNGTALRASGTALTFLLFGCLCPIGPVLLPVVSFWLVASSSLADLMIGGIALFGTAMEWTGVACLVFAIIKIWA